MFVRGYDNFDVEIQKNKNEGMKAQKKTRLFAKKGGTTLFAFVDDPGIAIHEHQLTFSGHNNFNNFYNCVGAHCPICHAGFKPNFVSIYTVLDLTKWEKDGKKHSFARKLFCPKNSEIAAIKKLREDFGGSLKGAVLSVTKGDGAKDRAAYSAYLNQGSIVRLSDQQMITMAANDGYKPDAVQPFNYDLVFCDDNIATLQGVIPRILVQNGQQNQQGQSNQQYGHNNGYEPVYGHQGQPSYSQPPQQFPFQNAPSQNGMQNAQPFSIPGQGFNPQGHGAPGIPQNGVALYGNEPPLESPLASMPDIPF